MYSTKTATVNPTEFTSSYMPVGINETVTLKEVNVNKTQKRSVQWIKMISL